MDIKLYENLGRDPIAGRSNVGENVRNDATFDIIKTEINKLNTVGATASPVWKVVAEASEKVLKNESKDLLAGSYLAYSLLEIKGIEGLLMGLTTMQFMLNDHWDNLYPPVTRMQGRVAALSWLSDSLDKYCDRHKDMVYDYATVAQLKVLMGQLDDFVSQKDQELSLHSALRLIESLPTTSAPTQSGGPGESSSAHEGAVQSAGGVVQGASVAMAGIPNADSVTIDSINVANQVASSAMALLKRVAAYFADNQKYDQVQLYLYKQVSLWSERYSYPKQHQGQTFIAAPDRREIDRLYGYYQARQYQDLLKESLGLMDRHPYWIDLVFYSVYALSNMGQNYPHCVRIMSSLTRDWMEAMPLLQHYSFVGGEIPFARQEALDWISSLSPNSKNRSQDQSLNTFLEDLAKIDKRTGADQLQSIMALQPYLKSSMKECYKIELLIKTIDVFVANQEKNFLANLIKLLTDKMTHFHLTDWDADLAKKALISIIHGKKLLDERVETELQQLSEIDMGASILLQKGPVAPPASP